MSAADFCDKLEGFYDNWFQAAKDPARYAHIKLRWERIGDNLFKSKEHTFVAHVLKSFLQITTVV